MRVKYSDYKKGRATVVIKEVDGSTPVPTPTPDAASGQGSPANPAVSPDQPVEGGILNARAIEMPLPDYPEEAKGSGASGEVQLRVLIDENGEVVSAQAVFGPEVLRASALAAVKRARFLPYLVNGTPLKITGIITYKFTPPPIKK